VGFAFVVGVLSLALLFFSFFGQWHLRMHNTTVAIEWRALRALCRWQDYMAVSMLVMYGIFIALAVLKDTFQVRAPLWMLYLLVLLMLLSLATVCLTDQPLIDVYKKNNARLLLMLGMLSLLVSYFSAPLADQIISEITEQDAALFPRAQAIIVVFMSLLGWPIALSVVGLLMLMPLTWDTLRTQTQAARASRTRYLGPAMQVEHRRLEFLGNFRRLNMIMVLAVVTVSVPYLALNLRQSPSFDWLVRETLVFGSFHVMPVACGLAVELPYGARIVPVRFKYAIAAIPQEGSYHFQLYDCRPEIAPRVSR
jgi:hypothetical protein